MFTGIIEGLGSLSQIVKSDKGMRLTVDADFELDRTKIGDSIAVSGACLTMVKIGGKRFQADVSPETLEKTTFDKAKIGERVNLERALRLFDRIDGHLVTGHIDGIGMISSKRTAGNAVIITFETPPSLLHFMIKKGSVAVDGISLTINNCNKGSFEVSLIPHTASLTTLGFKKIGDAVNIETDMIGKYVEQFMTGRINNSPDTSGSSIDKAYLIKTGFI
ncbi:MAG: riboflavin synthase [Deltaproteobacteria bacterium]|nr:riboflavin synthase [Deltaproteobacteria bacterium]